MCCHLKCLINAGKNKTVGVHMRRGWGRYFEELWGINMNRKKKSVYNKCLCLRPVIASVRRLRHFRLISHVCPGGRWLGQLTPTNSLYLVRWKLGLRAWSEVMIPLSSHIPLIIIRKVALFQSTIFLALGESCFAYKTFKEHSLAVSKQKKLGKKSVKMYCFQF